MVHSLKCVPHCNCENAHLIDFFSFSLNIVNRNINLIRPDRVFELVVRVWSCCARTCCRRRLAAVLRSRDSTILQPVHQTALLVATFSTTIDYYYSLLRQEQHKIKYIQATQWKAVYTHTLTQKHIYRVAQKSKPPPICQKIVLKIANEIRFFHKVKVWIKHYNKIRW